jgi:hypothetical protein
VLSFNSQIGSAKSNLLSGKIAPIKDIQKTLFITSLIYIEKYTSAPSPHQKIKRNKENEIALIENGIDHSFFLTIDINQLFISWSLL